MTSSDESRDELTTAPAGGRQGSILAVCTTNVSCSPYIERRLQAGLAGTSITVSSAGTKAVAGSAMEAPVAQRLADAGADPTAFAARELNAELVKSVDLVLCASRAHRSAVVQLVPALLRRTYALTDFSDLAAQVAASGASIPSGSEFSGSFVRHVGETIERAQVQARRAHRCVDCRPVRTTTTRLRPDVCPDR